MKSKAYNENPCSVRGFIPFPGFGYGLWSNYPAKIGGTRMPAHA